MIFQGAVRRQFGAIQAEVGCSYETRGRDAMPDASYVVRLERTGHGRQVVPRPDGRWGPGRDRAWVARRTARRMVTEGGQAVRGKIDGSGYTYLHKVQKINRSINR